MFKIWHGGSVGKRAPKFSDICGAPTLSPSSANTKLAPEIQIPPGTEEGPGRVKGVKYSPKHSPSLKPHPETSPLESRWPQLRAGAANRTRPMSIKHKTQASKQIQPTCHLPGWVYLLLLLPQSPALASVWWNTGLLNTGFKISTSSPTTKVSPMDRRNTRE